MENQNEPTKNKGVLYLKRQSPNIEKFYFRLYTSNYKSIK